VPDIQKRINQWIKDHREEGTNLLQKMVQAPSTQGNEAGAQAIVAQKLQEMGLQIDSWEPDGSELKKHSYFYSPRSEFSNSPNAEMSTFMKPCFRCWGIVAQSVISAL